MTAAARTAATATWGGRPVSGVLFDLDGTLLDTAVDIARALNLTLQERGWEEIPVDQVARMIGRGSPILIGQAAALHGRRLKTDERAALLERFFHHYGELEESNQSRAMPYPGAIATLRALHEAGLRIAVVTNKQWRFADGLLRRFDLMRWVDCLVGGDSCERRKPDPQPLLFACGELRIEAARALMVGDSVNDVSAARAAHIPVVCVPYGYNEGRAARSLACDALIDTLAELPALLWPQAGRG